LGETVHALERAATVIDNRTLKWRFLLLARMARAKIVEGISIYKYLERSRELCGNSLNIPLDKADFDRRKVIEPPKVNR
jgi:hypothetical protein